MSRRKDYAMIDKALEETLSNSSDIDSEQTKLLRRMIKRQDKDIMLSRIIAFAECGLLIVLIIVFAIMVPMFMDAVNRVRNTMDEVDVLVDRAETSLSEVTDLARDADKLIEANQEAISEAIGNFNSVDFDSLNNSIAGLAEVIQPMVDVVQILKE